MTLKQFAMIEAAMPLGFLVCTGCSFAEGDAMGSETQPSPCLLQNPRQVTNGGTAEVLSNSTQRNVQDVVVCLKLASRLVSVRTNEMGTQATCRVTVKLTGVQHTVLIVLARLAHAMSSTSPTVISRSASGSEYRSRSIERPATAGTEVSLRCR